MRKLFVFLCTLVMLLISCTPSTGKTPVNKNPDSIPDQESNPIPDSDSKDELPLPVKHLQKIEIEINESDFGTEWDWESRIEIPAEAFSVMEEGDSLFFSTTASSGDADYFQLKLATGDDFLGGNNEITEKASFDSEYYTVNLDSAELNTEIIPDKIHIQSLKENGLIITGYGTKISKIILNHFTVLLSDQKATDNTIRLYKYLFDMYGKNVITGQMENAWNNDFNQLGKVYESTGKYPALMGFDFIDYTVDWAINSNFNKQTERAINFWNGKDYAGKKISDSHGIVTFCWHWQDPINHNTHTPDETSFRIPYDEESKRWKTESAEYKAILEDLDVVASELLKLQENGVPVIWRPLHEAAGNLGRYENKGTSWFWWGAGNTTEAYTDDEGNIKYKVSSDLDECSECFIALWKLMYNYFTNEKNIHNLIWLWNGQNEKFYPGSEYVDIIGEDIYELRKNQTGKDVETSSGIDIFRRAHSVDSSKLIALSECGEMPSMENLIKDKAMWSFFMVWNDGNNEPSNDNFWNGNSINPDSHKREVYESETAITLDELPDLTNY